MHSRVFLLLLTFAMCELKAQDVNFESILNSKQLVVDVYDTAKVKSKICLNTDFSESIILNDSLIKLIKSETVLEVKLVYSLNKYNKTFDQRKLNEERLKALHVLYPELFFNKMIKWELVAQKLSKSKVESSFHGFVFICRPRYSTDAEIDWLTSMIEGSRSLMQQKDTLPQNMPATYIGGQDALNAFFKRNMIYPDSAKKSMIAGEVSVQFLVSADGDLHDAYVTRSIGYGCDEEALRLVAKMPCWIPARKNGKQVDFISTVKIKFEMPNATEVVAIAQPLKSSFVKQKNKNNKTRARIYQYTGIDVTVFRVFERNDKWEHVPIVADLTGSMVPYSAQLLLWFELSMTQKKDLIENFTFFNDGDKKADGDKKIGKTGGIYYGKAESFEEVKALAVKTMKGGNGGDCPENNVEALIVCIKKNPECKEVVMIADNWATPKDMELLKYVEKPVRVIVCGVIGYVNPAYLTIARVTKGSVHTMEEDLFDLMEINEGETLNIGGQQYILKKGEFVRVSEI